MTVHQLTKQMRQAHLDVSFDEFWKLYPRKRAKAAARKAFGRIKWTPEKWEKLQKTLEWQRREWSEPRFIPYPATYLNQERWDDEPDAEAAVCAWPGCWKGGIDEHRNGLHYCDMHMQALERGETPVGR